MSFILEVGEFFKREEKLPFQFSAIEERRSGTNYFVWIIGVIGVAIIITFFYLLLK